MKSSETFKSRNPYIWSGIYGFCLFMFIKHFVETKSQNVRQTSNFKPSDIVCSFVDIACCDLKVSNRLWLQSIHVKNEPVHSMVSVSSNLA